MFRLNREKFFAGYRAAFGPLQQLQVEGLSFLLDKLEEDDFTIPQAAYVLATVSHETGVERNGIPQTFQPIKEIRERRDSPRRANQDRYWLTNYFGRGYLQITWKKNYQKFGIADEPEKALEPETAYRILSVGMKTGAFTGNKLSDYISDGKADYHNARRVINGTDKADLIAEKARTFQGILEASLKPTEMTIGGKRVHVTTNDGTATISVPDDKPDEAHDDGAPAVEVKQDPPARIELKPQGASWTTKIAAGATAITPVLTAAGIKIGGIELSAGGVYALAAIVVVGMIVGAILYDRGQTRAHEKTRWSQENLANPSRQNVIVGTGGTS